MTRGFKVNLFRIIQEQLNNIAKYAAASQVWIHIDAKKSLLVTVRDDGKGFDPSVKPKGIGLMNIRNRAELYEGKMELTSSPGKGCSLSLSFPLSDKKTI